ncbi:MAG: hypothetical protein NVS3B21_13490 [Acidimicrobiales bacterium]
MVASRKRMIGLHNEWAREGRVRGEEPSLCEVPSYLVKGLRGQIHGLSAGLGESLGGLCASGLDFASKIAAATVDPHAQRLLLARKRARKMELIFGGLRRSGLTFGLCDLSHHAPESETEKGNVGACRAQDLLDLLVGSPER